MCKKKHMKEFLKKKIHCSLNFYLKKKTKTED